MRRFEFTEGTSNKFWEIDVEGTSVTTRWGRIGTDGQTKSKDLGSAEKAEAEADKQIRGKTKKGYTEVAGGEPSRTPVQEPSPEPAPVEEPAPEPASREEPPKKKEPRKKVAGLPDEDTFVMPAAWKPLHHARRGGVYVPRDEHDPSAQWKAVRADWTHDALDQVPGDATSMDVEALTALLAQAQKKEGCSEEAAEALVRWALGTFPLPLVVEAWLRAWPMQRSLYFDDVPGVRWMRRAVAAASDEAYEESLAAAETVRNDEPLKQTLVEATDRYIKPAQRLEHLLAYLFPDAGWWRAVTLAYDTPAELYTCVGTEAEAVAFRATVRRGYREGILETVAAELQAASVAAVVEELEGVKDQVEQATRVLSELPLDEAIGPLLDHHTEKVVAKRLPRLLKRWPRRMLRLGLERRERSGMSVLLAGWICDHPQAVDAILPDLDAGARRLVEQTREQLANRLPDADLASLPELFRSPPWAGRSKKTHTPVSVEPSYPEPEVRWSEEDEAALVKMRGLVEKAREAWDSNRYVHELARPIAALQGLDVEEGKKRLKRCYLPDEGAQDLVVGFFGLLDMEMAAELVWQPDAPRRVQYLVPVAHRRVAEEMLASLGTKSRRGWALAWAETHPRWASAAWTPAAVGKPSRSQKEALAALRKVAAIDRDAVLEGAATYGDEVVSTLEGLLDLDPLLFLPAKRPKSIDFWAPAVLPRPKLRDRDEVLPLEALEVAAICLAVSPLDDPYAGVDVLKETCDARSLKAFSWGLFEQWMAAGAPSKEDWALTQLGLLGDDEIAGKLTPSIRRWPGESQHKRAVKGLDVLLSIGTDVALMHLNGVAQKVKFKGIQTNAQERIQQLADELGLTREELADRLVPDMGLDEDGSMVLDYGPRQFTVIFDETLKPVVREADTGKVRASLPKPGAKDDGELAPEAQARFKQLKKDVRTLGKLQIARLESAMVLGRRWSQEDFGRFLAGHPLLVHLVRRLVWGVYEDELVGTFRVAEDGSYADASDEESELPTGSVGVLHPVDADAETLAAWGTVLSDYELLQPFEQLGRPVMRREEEDASRVCPAPSDAPVPVGRLLGLLSRGWHRGEAQDGGVSHWLSMPLPDGQHEVRLWLGGVGLWTGMGADQDEDPTVQGWSVVKRASYAWEPEGDRELSELPASLWSEVQLAVHGLFQA